MLYQNHCVIQLWIVHGLEGLASPAVIIFFQVFPLILTKMRFRVCKNPLKVLLVWMWFKSSWQRERKKWEKKNILEKWQSAEHQGYLSACWVVVFFVLSWNIIFFFLKPHTLGSNCHHHPCLPSSLLFMLGPQTVGWSCLPESLSRPAQVMIDDKLLQGGKRVPWRHAELLR